MPAALRPVTRSLAVGLLAVATSLPMAAQGAQGRAQGSGQPAPQTGRGEGRGQQQRRDAREMAPEGLIGTWVQNMEKSKYDPGPNNLKSQVRQFDYSRDGMILCHYIQTRQDGGKTIGHWIVTLDGREWEEWSRSSGSQVIALVGIKKVDDYNMAITVRRAGRLIQDGMWTISADGKTLTQVLRSIAADGKITSNNTAVFEKVD